MRLYDPISDEMWPRAREGADIVTLSTSTKMNGQAVVLVPRDFDDENLQCGDVAVALIGYPQQLSSNGLSEIFSRVRATGSLPKYEQESLRREFELQVADVESALHESFNGFTTPVMSLGHTLKRTAMLCPGEKTFAIAVTNTSTVGQSGSPFFMPDRPDEIVGVHLGGGVWPEGTSRNVRRVRRNYNMFISVNDPEFVLLYAEQVLPGLPDNHLKRVVPYLRRHRDLLHASGLLGSLEL